MLMTADAIQHAVERTASEFSSNTSHNGDSHYYIWNDSHKGTFRANGTSYLRQGVIVYLDDEQVVVRAVVDNGLNAGEVRLTGFATRSIELIAGAIETALEFI
jgi:hypothetical protein